MATQVEGVNVDARGRQVRHQIAVLPYKALRVFGITMLQQQRRSRSIGRPSVTVDTRPEIPGLRIVRVCRHRAALPGR